MIDIEKVEKEIVERLKPLEPDRIILFGSYAYGEPDEESDLDLYVVTADETLPKSWREKNDIYLRYSKPLREIRKKIALDLLVHTREMHRKFRELNGSFFREMEEKGKVLL